MYVFQLFVLRLLSIVIAHNLIMLHVVVCRLSDSEASRALRVTGIDQTFLNAQKQTTFFAPSDHAFAEMQDDRVGVRLLDRDNSRNLERVSVRRTTVRHQHDMCLHLCIN